MVTLHDTFHHSIIKQISQMESIWAEYTTTYFNKEQSFTRTSLLAAYVSKLHLKNVYHELKWIVGSLKIGSKTINLVVYHRYILYTLLKLTLWGRFPVHCCEDSADSDSCSDMVESLNTTLVYWFGWFCGFWFGRINEFDLG